MSVDVVPAAPSPAPVSEPSGSTVLAGLTPDQLQTWRSTGDLPDSTLPDGSSPAAPGAIPDVAQAPVSEPKPAVSEPAKPHRNAESRKAELAADIQADLATRARIRQDIAAETERLEALRRPPAPPAPDVPAGPSPAAGSAPADDPEPKMEDFEDASKYPDPYIALVNAQARWAARQEWKAQESLRLQAAQLDRVQTAIRTRDTAFQERLNAVRSADPEFAASLSPEVQALRPFSALRPGEPITDPAGHAIADAILESSVGPQLMRHFSQHTEELARLRTVPPAALFRAIGRLEAQIDAPSATPAGPPPVTHAPAPGTTLGSRPVQPPADAAADAEQRGDFIAYKDAANRAELARLKGR